MSIAKYNKSNTNWGIDTTDFLFHSLSDLYTGEGENAKIYQLKGLYINTKSKYGKAPVAIMADKFVNLPKHLTDTVEGILNDADVVEQIKADKAGFKVRQYDDTKNGSGTQYTIDFVDIE